MFRRRTADPWSEESRADDAEAEALLARTGTGVRRARRISHGVLTAALLVFPIAGIVFALLDAFGGPAEAVGMVLVAALATGVVALLAWSVLADVDTRTVRAAGVRWLETAPPDSRARGLPRPFSRAWWEFPPGHRILAIAAYLGAAVGLALVAAVPAVLVEGWPPALTLLGLPGLALLALAVRFVVVHRRRRRADRDWLARAAAPRPPV